MRKQYQYLASYSGLKIWYCRELWYRLQMCLRSRIAVAVVQAGYYSSNSTSSLEISICLACGPKKTKKKKKKNLTKRRCQYLVYSLESLYWLYNDTTVYLCIPVLKDISAISHISAFKNNLQ